MRKAGRGLKLRHPNRIRKIGWQKDEGKGSVSVAVAPPRKFRRSGKPPSSTIIMNKSGGAIIVYHQAAE